MSSPCWISSRLPPIPTPLGYYRDLIWVPWGTQVSLIVGRCFSIWATRKSHITAQKHQFFGTQLSLCPTLTSIQINSVQFSHSVMSDSLRPHESQHARPPCSSQTPGVCSNTCSFSWWCHPVISSSVVPFSSYPQSLPASGSLPMSQFFAWGGQSTGVSASTSVLPMSTQDWSALGWTGWISLQSKGLSRVFSNTTSIHDYWKNHIFD